MCPVQALPLFGKNTSTICIWFDKLFTTFITPTHTGYSLILDDIDGDLPVLGELGGFRNFIQEGANKYNIKGTIQRIPTTRAKLYMICTENTFIDFYNEFLLVQQKIGMFKVNHESYTHAHFYLPLPLHFDILKNSTHMVHDGEYSSKELDSHKFKMSADYQAQGV